MRNISDWEKKDFIYIGLNHGGEAERADMASRGHKAMISANGISENVKCTRQREINTIWRSPFSTHAILLNILMQGEFLYKTRSENEKQSWKGNILLHGD